MMRESATAESERSDSPDIDAGVSVADLMDDIPVELNGSSSSLNTDDDVQSDSKYPPTPHQLDIYSKSCPSQDELDSSSMSLYSGPPMFTSQAYRGDMDINVPTFCSVVNRICMTYGVLCTHFYRNDKILDADVEGLVERMPWADVPQSQFVEVVNPDEHPSLTILNPENITAFVSDWISARERLDRTFTVILIKTSSTGRGYPIVIIIASNAIADEITCSWVSGEIFNLYAQCQKARDGGATEQAARNIIDGYRGKENYNFLNHAYDISPNKQAIEYWRKQCIETVQDVVDENEKADLQHQLRRLNLERDSLRTQVASLYKRKPELEHELQVLKQQRMEADEDGSGEMTTYLDAASGEIIRISEHSKAALIKTVLGEEATSNNITALLDKHEVPADVQRKIGASDMTLEAFASLPEGVIADVGLFTKDRRKILALSEYVRNRIKECLQERSKVKFTLERRIAKVARDLDSCSDHLKKAQDTLESNDDMCMRLSNILNPPYVEVKVAPVTLDSQAESPFSSSSDALSPVKNNAETWAFCPITVASEVLTHLRSFQEGYRTTLRQRRAHLHTSAIPVSGHDSDVFGSSMDESSGTDSDASGLRSRHARLTSTAGVCLAAFAVLLKHISGSDKFLVGLTQSYRHNGLLVGPLTDTVPLKVEFRKGTTFNSVFGVLSKEMKEARRFGATCPLSVIKSKLGARWNLPVRFEFVPFQEAEGWRMKGLGVEDLTLHERSGGDGVGQQAHKWQRLWSVDETAAYDLKLVLVEGHDTLSGGIRYRKDRFDEEKVAKWVAKYAATLESIDFGPRKIPITNMISRYGLSLFWNVIDVTSAPFFGFLMNAFDRFYQSVWHSSSQLPDSVSTSRQGSLGEITTDTNNTPLT
ncbi:hypothetical protein HDV00_004537 [Rhizophlyctis rosea]|nr:hypothetical protein HDV00_004537 [Rhizophlyctis rosea]